MLCNLHLFSSECRLFHNATLFGFCITHILNTGVLKFEKKKSVAKKLSNFNILGEESYVMASSNPMGLVNKIQ